MISAKTRRFVEYAINLTELKTIDMTIGISLVSNNLLPIKRIGGIRLRLSLFLFYLTVFCVGSMLCACNKEEDSNKKPRASMERDPDLRSAKETFRADKFFSPFDEIPDLHLEVLSESDEVVRVKLGDLVKSPDAKAESVVLLNFWASWCVPCVKELPDLELLHKNNMVKGLRVISINTDAPTQRSKVLALKTKFNLTFPILLDPELESVEKFHISGFPETFLVNQFGKFILFKDPKSGENLLRILSDREWSSAEVIAALQSSIKEADK